MSKAFTKEDDEIPERIVRVRPASGLPPGALNYMTADGGRRLRQELEKLRSKESGDAHEQIAELQRAISSATIVPPREMLPEEVLFGAAVTVRGTAGNISRYRIVGVDETHLDADAISWVTPLAKALIGARVGDRVRLSDPPGSGEIEIIEVRY